MCLITGDNLGFQCINGLAESFNANFFCHFCKNHREITQTQKLEVVESLRTIENYKQDVLTNDFSTTGINSNCM